MKLFVVVVLCALALAEAGVLNLIREKRQLAKTKESLISENTKDGANKATAKKAVKPTQGTPFGREMPQMNPGSMPMRGGMMPTRGGMMPPRGMLPPGFNPAMARRQGMPPMMQGPFGQEMPNMMQNSAEYPPEMMQNGENGQMSPPWFGQGQGVRPSPQGSDGTATRTPGSAKNQQNGMRPPMSGRFPQDMPPYMMQGPGPYPQRMSPMQQGMPPMRPMRQGMSPMQQGMSPMQQGMSPMQPGMSPMQQGMSPMQQGMSPMQQGMSPMQQGMSPMQQGMPLMQQGMPLMQQGMPRGMPMLRPGMPPMMSQGMPLMPQGMPLMPQGMPQGMGPMPHGMPVNKHGQNAPGKTTGAATKTHPTKSTGQKEASRPSSPMFPMNGPNGMPHMMEPPMMDSPMMPAMRGHPAMNGPPQSVAADTLDKFMSFEHQIEDLRSNILKSFYKDLVEYKMVSEIYRAKMMAKLALLNQLEAKVAMPVRNTIAYTTTSTDSLGSDSGNGAPPMYLNMQN